VYAILGEDRSDANTLRVLVRKLANNDSLKVTPKGFRGGSEMLRKGAMELRRLRRRGCTRFIICHDADGPDPGPKRELVRNQVVEPSGVAGQCCIVIPVQELEAWILANIECATKVFPSWVPKPIDNPEGIPKPKEHLEGLSKGSKGRPRYSHATHNEQMAKYLDLDVVKRKCPSFRGLAEFVAG